MSTQGIRISDIKGGKCILLSELLANIPDGHGLNWGLLWFDVIPKEGIGKPLFELQKEVKKSDNGLHYTFAKLNELSRNTFQEIEVLIIGCKNKENLHRYEDDQEMYETCDIVIEMIDGGFWEVFSKNRNWIEQLARKYEKVKTLTSDFQKKDNLK